MKEYNRIDDEIHLEAMKEGENNKIITIEDFYNKAIELQFNPELTGVLNLMLNNLNEQEDEEISLNKFYLSLFKNNSPVGVPLINYLIEHAKVDVNYTDSSGSSCLHQYYWRKHGDVELLSLLIEKGVNVNGKDNIGNTALHKFLMKKSKNEVALVNLLLEKGASLNQKNIWGHSPFFCFSSRNNITGELFELLLKYGADPEKKENNDESFKTMFLKKQNTFKEGISKTTPKTLSFLDDFIDDITIIENHKFKDIQIEDKAKYLCSNDLIYN